MFEELHKEMSEWSDTWKAAQSEPWDSKTTPKIFWAAYDKEFNIRLNRIMSYRWEVGFKDRGMGHGDFVVIVKYNHQTMVVVECPFKEVADHIVKIHNAPLSETAFEPPLMVKYVTDWEDNLFQGDRDDDGTRCLKRGEIYEAEYCGTEYYTIYYNKKDKSKNLPILKTEFEIVR